MSTGQFGRVWVQVLALALLVTSTHGAGVRLIDAVKTGSADAVRAVLKQKADVNATESDGTTPLHWAVHHGDLELTQRLIRAGARVNASTASVFTFAAATAFSCRACASLSSIPRARSRSATQYQLPVASTTARWGPCKEPK